MLFSQLMLLHRSYGFPFLNMEVRTFLGGLTQNLVSTLFARLTIWPGLRISCWLKVAVAMDSASIEAEKRNNGKLFGLFVLPTK